MNQVEAGRIFDSLPESGKDIPRDLFIAKACKLTDPKLIQRDLSRMVHGKTEERRIRSAIRRER